jgi:hypothetical protein
MSTFAQQTTRSRHTSSSSSSITTPTTTDGSISNNKQFGTIPRTTQSRERINSVNKINPSSLSSTDLSTIDGSMFTFILYFKINQIKFLGLSSPRQSNFHSFFFFYILII